MPLFTAVAAELTRRSLFATPLGATLLTSSPAPSDPVPMSAVGSPGGVAALDATGSIPLPQLPDEVLTDTGERPVAKGELVYNVHDYGATGDGTTDDLPAIDAAIDAAVASFGGVVYFPRGIYRIAGSIGRASGLSSVVFRGAGELSTRVQSLTNAPVVSGAFTSCRLDNLILDANGLGSPCISAHLDKSVLDSLQLYGWTDYGMRLNDGTFGDLGLLNRIQRCSIDQCTGTGIWASYRMIDSWIVENNVGASYADISVEGGPLRILGNHLDGSPQLNIELRGNRRITIANNIMEGARRQSLVYTMPPWLDEDLAQIQIVGNAISNGGKGAANTYPAIQILGVSPSARTAGFSVTGNIFACEDDGAGWTHCVEAVNARAVSVLGNQWATGHLSAHPVRAVGSTAYEVIGNHGDNAVTTV
ncbi:MULTISPECIES: glycosyl hydrolase family 28-related protein [unclassified Rathayibacter]|uniref:glycosyl hydrolase family 28-related protein n=1 Tax=unclassified Rathayibacter TaxID=2609250 RepID=UPI00188D1EEC|nr:MULTISPECIES: glycosyl hydrolase family 28-related protein [unclassified Rathayibacter]MBF4461029.1 right-handed parallel beta-helix repeat-containing protein [Rathayibacter sp. VKM Ac-2879]MBF4502440.1 right-handed parallel beta-helix repeat-containing protein [Rathayibacter sp. VKM Ac-2878]